MLLNVKKKKLQFYFEWEEKLPRYIQTDEVKLRQILINLLNNGIKFTEQGGITVWIRWQEQESNEHRDTADFESSIRLIVEITDTGPGIPADEMDKLFQAFSQTESGRQAQEGTGLGLVISRQFVQLMGGDIRVESPVSSVAEAMSEFGPGTRFTFDIVAHIVDQSLIPDKMVASERTVIALAPGQPHYRILIVDDKATNRELLIKLLAPFGFDLQSAENGEEAIKLWEMWQPHLIWMDIRMPVLDGYEATRQIRQRSTEHPEWSEPKIIGITASVYEEKREQVIQAGCDDFLRKPFKENQLFALMSEHIGVEFLYDEPTAAIETESIPLEEMDDILATIPERLLVNLKKAAINLDIFLIEEIVAEIRDYHSALANQIEMWLEEFEYQEIVDLLEKYEDE